MGQIDPKRAFLIGPGTEGVRHKPVVAGEHREWISARDEMLLLIGTVVSLDVNPG